MQRGKCSNRKYEYDDEFEDNYNEENNIVKLLGRRFENKLANHKLHAEYGDYDELYDDVD